MFRFWEKYSFAVDHVLSIIGIALAAFGLFIAQQAIHVIANNSASADAKVIIFNKQMQNDFENSLRDAEAESIVECKETYDNGSYQLEISGKSGFYPNLVYNVESSPSAYKIAKSISRLMRGIDRLNSNFNSSLFVDSETTGWADLPVPRSTAEYIGITAVCFVREPNKVAKTLILSRGDNIRDNVQLACARAADFNRSAGIGSILPGSAELFGVVSGDTQIDGSSRGVDVKITISGFLETESPLKLCPEY